MLLIATTLVAPETLADSNVQSFASAEPNRQRSLRIIGGEDTEVGGQSWMVSIEYKEDPGIICGASVLGLHQHYQTLL